MLKLGKWRVLVMGAEFDRAEVPLYRSSFRSGCPTLLKTLYSSSCRMDCKYCMFRAGCPLTPRRRWDKRKLVEVTLRLHEAGVIRGLFLTSAMSGDPDRVVEDEVGVAEELRRRGFKGYIHLRLMPGVSRDLVWRAAMVADRIGVNVETIGPSEFSDIAPSKGDWRTDIIKRLEWAVQAYRRLRGEGRLRAGVSTQLMVGVVGESDREILGLVERLYRLGLRRVFFSAFTPLPGTPFEHRRPTPLWREYRLYQASELIRLYGFKLEDLETIMVDGMLPDEDLKEAYAKANEDMYPVDADAASLQDLLRVPGIGLRGALKLLEVREEKGRLHPADVIRALGWARARRALRYMAFSSPNIPNTLAKP